MKLENLFKMQQVLDEHILNEHPELRGQHNFGWKILALLVELGECSNEWRGFKKWSKDQKPRVRKARAPYVDLEDAVFYNPLLEEYVDCLHFILSIGLEASWGQLADTDYTPGGFNKSFWNCEYTIEQFQIVYRKVTDFSMTYDFYDYVDVVEEFLGLGDMLGFVWEEIEEAYFAKNEVNHQRQDNHY